jgi:hypothetical protein
VVVAVAVAVAVAVTVALTVARMRAAVMAKARAGRWWEVPVTVTVAVVRALVVLVGIRRQCAERQRQRWTGGDGMTRGDATTSCIKGARGMQ